MDQELMHHRMVNRGIGRSLLALSMVVAMLTMGCHGPEHDTNVDRIKALEVEGVTYDISALDLIEEARILPVLNEIGDTLFFTPRRTEHLKSFPCSNCHTGSLETLQRSLTEADKDAHWDIEIEHASEKNMACTSCHSPEDVSQLHTITGSTVHLNESHQLCAQCHSTQHKDWLGGAHGKRLGGWVSPRVSNTCVNCHNPHQPAFPKRWPARYRTGEEASGKAVGHSTNTTPQKSD